MKFVLLLVMITFAMTAGSPVQAQQLGSVPRGCYRDLSGKLSCPPMGGELQVTLEGQAVCGKGRCVRDLFGKVTCSAQPGGQVTQDVNGNVACVGGCEQASPAYCQTLN